MGHALATDPEQQQRSAYMTFFQQPGRAEQALLADDAAALSAVFEAVGDRERVARYVDPMREPGALTAALNWYRAMAPGDLSDLGPVRVPTTFVWSDQDTAVGRVAAESCAVHVTGEYRFVALTGVSHWVPDEAPGALAEEILSRVDSVR
jgi:pimeloyl-ACP methyl ester carboxylesterase